MKVVHFITRLIIGGAQENTLLTVEDQQHEYGDDVTLIAGPGLGPEGSLEARARNREIDVRIMPELYRNIHPWSDWRSYREFIRLLRELRPDVLHTHSSKAGILGRAAAWKLGIPAVHTIHGPSFYAEQNPMIRRAYVTAEQWAHRRCRKVISVCDAMTDHYVAAGMSPREKYVTIYSGMKVDQFLNPPRSRDTIRAELGLNEDHLVVGKVARLFHLKGHEYVIRAARRIASDCPEIRFLFVGDGILRGTFETEIAKAGLQEHFIFAGLVSPAKVPEMIAAMDIVVHTSLREGLARALPQALIAGKPIIAYDVDGAREVAIPHKTGYLLPPKSVDALADAIIQLARNADLRRRYGQAGRQQFTEQFRHETMTRRIREVYASVME